MEASSEISFDSSFVERSSSPVISSGLDSSTVRARRHRTFEEQLADRNTPPLDSVNSRMPRESLATATYKGNRYVREDALASKNKRPPKQCHQSARYFRDTNRCRIPFFRQFLGMPSL